MGAGAICALLAVTPSRFQRVVLALPASIDAPIAREGEFETMASAWEAADHARFAEVLISTLPQEAQGVSAAWGADEAARLLALPGMGAALRAVPGETPLRDRAVLTLVTADVLVIGQEGDPAHPAQVARELAGCFPNGRSVILPPGGLLHRHRSQVRDLVRDALV
jgi:3-oxoadipate enol-lactonase